MPDWLASLLFAVLVVTIPYTLILKIMLRLPKALALSHRRWPSGLNIALIAAITEIGRASCRERVYVLV